MRRALCWVAAGGAAVGAACQNSPRAEYGSPAVLSAAEQTPMESAAWTFQGNRGVAYTTAHYRLLTTVQRELVRDRLAGFAEASLARFRAEFPELPEPRAGLEIFVLSSRPEWERFVAEVFGADGVGRYRAIERGGFTEGGRSVLWDIGVQDTLAIVAHEGWHQFAQVVLREPLPTWIDEGIAAWSEGFRWDPAMPYRPVFLPWANVERFDQLRRAGARDGFMPLTQLLTERPQELMRVSSESTLTYYAQCWALAHFLLSEPELRAGLGRLLEDAAAGRVGATVRERFGDRAARSAMLRRVGPEVWTVYFGGGPEAFEERYAAYLERIIAPGTKGRIVRGESPMP